VRDGGAVAAGDDGEEVRCATLCFPAAAEVPGGYVLITAALATVMLIGVLGLVQDLARMYAVRNELQAFADAASIAAALQLNGTDEGITHATSAATTYPNQRNFRTATAQNITVNGPRVRTLRARVSRSSTRAA
jgi:uncharacterized membrane protein